MCTQRAASKYGYGSAAWGAAWPADAHFPASRRKSASHWIPSARVKPRPGITAVLIIPASRPAMETHGSGSKMTGATLRLTPPTWHVGQFAFVCRDLLAARLHGLLDGRQPREAIDRIVQNLLHEFGWAARALHVRSGFQDRVAVRRESNVGLGVVACHSGLGSVRATPYYVARAQPMRRTTSSLGSTWMTVVTRSLTTAGRSRRRQPCSSSERRTRCRGASIPARPIPPGRIGLRGELWHRRGVGESVRLLQTCGF